MLDQDLTCQVLTLHENLTRWSFTAFKVTHSSSGQVMNITIPGGASAVLVVAIFIAAFDGAVQAQEWGSIRGPNYDGSATADDAVLARGPLSLKVVWKRPLGSGYSSVVQSGDVIVSAMADPEADQEFVVAMESGTGKLIWRTPTGKIMKGENGSFDGPIATPAADERHAYHLSPLGKLAAYKLSDGEIAWSHDLTAEFSAEPNFYGFGASPIVLDGVLILPVGAPDGAVMGFDAASGDVLWKVGDDGAAFQSPIPYEIEGQTAVLVPSNKTLFAIRPKTGQLIWSQPHGGAEGIPTFSIIPVPLDGSGVFIGDERDASTVIEINKSGAKERWSGREIRNSYCVPVMSGGLLCSYSSRFLVAVDPATGERIWRSRTPGNGFLASIAGHLVAATLDGALHIGDVSEDGFEELAAVDVFDSKEGGEDGLMWALPSISKRSIYLRSLGAIARIDVLPQASESSVAADQSQVSVGFQAFLDQIAADDDKQATIDNYLDNRSTPIIDGDYVHFVYRGDHKDVALACDLFGVRQERVMKHVVGSNLFYYGVKVPSEIRASYLFFADYQPKVDPLNHRKVVSSTLTGEMEPNFLGPGTPLTFSWFDKGGSEEESALVDKFSADLAGELESVELESKSLGTKVKLSIYLPPGYRDSDQTYPAVFVHDGEVALQHGNQAHILDQLIQSKSVRPAVAVFIHRRFYPMLGAQGYPEMFAGELLPMIDEKYRVSDQPADRASMGGGFGATLGLMGTLPIRSKIGRIGCHSPFAFELLHPVIAQLSKIPGPPCEALIQWGEFDIRNPSENWDMANQSQAIAHLLGEAGHQVSSEMVSTGSDWVCWRAQSPRMWKFLLGE